MRRFTSPPDKLEGLQDLNLWKATKISAGMAQFIYAGRFSVLVPCVNFVPIVSRVTIDRLPLPGKRQDPFPALSDLTLQTAVKWVRNMGDATTNREVCTFLIPFTKRTAPKTNCGDTDCNFLKRLLDIYRQAPNATQRHPDKIPCCDRNHTPKRYRGRAEHFHFQHQRSARYRAFLQSKRWYC